MAKEKPAVPEREDAAAWELPAYAAKRISEAVMDAIEDRPKGGMRVGTPRVTITLDLNYAEALARHLAPTPKETTTDA